MDIKFEIFHPINLNEIFDIRVDESPWKDQPRYIQRENGCHDPNRGKYFKFSELLIPKNDRIKAFFKADSSSNYGIYILIFNDFKKYYVGIAARYSYIRGGILKRLKRPEGVLKRLRKHRAKCTGTFAQGVDHTNKAPYGWRDFAQEREAFYAEKKQTDTMIDCLLSLIVFENHEDYKDDDKGILQKLENHISKNGLSKHFGEEFNDYESFAHTNSQALDFKPVFEYRNFMF